MSEDKEISSVELQKPVDEAFIYVVYDKGLEFSSPVYESPSDLHALRGFKLKTLRELPVGFERKDFLLYRVGYRVGLVLHKEDTPVLIFDGANYEQEK